MVALTRKEHLTAERRCSRHAEMANGHLQLRTLLNDLSHLGHLSLIVGQAHRQNHATLLHQLESRHQRLQRLMHAMTREGYALQSSIGNGLCLLYIPRHTHTEEAVWILLLHLRKIIVLTAVDDLLHHDGSTHLGIIHIGEEDLGSVLTVNHKRREHLHFFVHKDAASVL